MEAGWRQSFRYLAQKSFWTFSTNVGILCWPTLQQGNLPCCYMSFKGNTTQSSGFCILEQLKLLYCLQGQHQIEHIAIIQSESCQSVEYHGQVISVQKELQLVNQPEQEIDTPSLKRQCWIRECPQTTDLLLLEQTIFTFLQLKNLEHVLPLSFQDSTSTFLVNIQSITASKDLSSTSATSPYSKRIESQDLV